MASSKSVRPSGSLVPVEGQEQAFAACLRALLEFKRHLSAEEYNKVRGQVVAALCQSKIATVTP